VVQAVSSSDGDVPVDRRWSFHVQREDGSFKDIPYQLKEWNSGLCDCSATECLQAWCCTCFLLQQNVTHISRVENPDQDQRCCCTPEMCGWVHCLAYIINGSWFTQQANPAVQMSSSLLPKFLLASVVRDRVKRSYYMKGSKDCDFGCHLFCPAASIGQVNRYVRHEQKQLNNILETYNAKKAAPPAMMMN